MSLKEVWCNNNEKLILIKGGKVSFYLIVCVEGVFRGVAHKGIRLRRPATGHTGPGSRFRGALREGGEDQRDVRVEGFGHRLTGRPTDKRTDGRGPTPESLSFLSRPSRPDRLDSLTTHPIRRLGVLLPVDPSVARVPS